MMKKDDCSGELKKQLGSELKKQLELCSSCGLCKQNCPTFRLLLNESYSPRGRSILLKEGVIDQIFYACALCKSCEKNCPSGIEIPKMIRKAREKLVEKGDVPEETRKMIENIREYGNPFGKFKKGEIPEDLHCC
jgi:Fe-S oxidoreductase